MSPYLLLAVGTGGFVGAVLRFVISTYIQKGSGIGFPVGTLSVNIIGSLIIGFLILYFEQIIAPVQKAFLITGMLGALTTFSTFSYETVAMLQGSLYMRALSNVFVNVLLTLSATILGMILFKKLYG